MLIQEFAPPLLRRKRTVERFQPSLEDRVGLGLRPRRSDFGSQPAEYMQPHHLFGGRVVQPIPAGQHGGLHAQW